MSDERISPEITPEANGDRWLKLAEAAVLLGLTERQAREWVRTRALPVTTGRPARIAESTLLAAMRREGKTPRPLPEIPPEVSGDAPEVPPEIAGSRGEPIEAVYRVGPAEVEQAIERTSARYVADFTGLYERITATLAERYAAEIAAKDAALSTQAETIAELRRRAEVAEAALATAEAQNAPPAAPQPRTDEEARPASEDAPIAPRAAGGFWARLRRVFGGE